MRLFRVCRTLVVDHVEFCLIPKVMGGNFGNVILFTTDVMKEKKNEFFTQSGKYISLRTEMFPFALCRFGMEYEQVNYNY